MDKDEIKKNPEEASHIHSPPTRQQCCEINLQEFNQGYQKNIYILMLPTWGGEKRMIVEHTRGSVLLNKVSLRRN